MPSQEAVAAQQGSLKLLQVKTHVYDNVTWKYGEVFVFVLSLAEKEEKLMKTLGAVAVKAELVRSSGWGSGRRFPGKYSPVKGRERRLWFESREELHNKSL